MQPPIYHICRHLYSCPLHPSLSSAGSGTQNTISGHYMYLHAQDNLQLQASACTCPRSPTVPLCTLETLVLHARCPSLDSAWTWTHISTVFLNASVGAFTDMLTVIFPSAEPTCMHTDFGLCMNLHSHTCWPKLPSVRSCTHMATVSICPLWASSCTVQLHLSDLSRHLHSRSTGPMCPVHAHALTCPLTACPVEKPALTCTQPPSGLCRQLSSHSHGNLLSQGTCTLMPTAPTCLLQNPVLTCPLSPLPHTNMPTVLLGSDGNCTHRPTAPWSPLKAPALKDLHYQHLYSACTNSHVLPAHLCSLCVPAFTCILHTCVP